MISFKMIDIQEIVNKTFANWKTYCETRFPHLCILGSGDYFPNSLKSRRSNCKYQEPNIDKFTNVIHEKKKEI